jgi:hypothetical protein
MLLAGSRLEAGVEAVHSHLLAWRLDVASRPLLAAGPPCLFTDKVRNLALPFFGGMYRIPAPHTSVDSRCS